MIRCQFNSTHLVPEKEMKLHLETCESKIDVLRFMYHSQENEGQEPMPGVSTSAPAPRAAPTENWQSAGSASYDPKKYCYSANVINTIQHRTPSERKAIREQERRRLCQLQNEK
jgi:hypothetical protein